VIHTNGTIAAVYFDFVFNVDGKANNRGSETWQLVKAADGWRSASIICSSEPPVQQETGAKPQRLMCTRLMTAEPWMWRCLTLDRTVHLLIH
jgi:hypothetical protein